MFLKKRNISSKIKRSKVTGYAALTVTQAHVAKWDRVAQSVTFLATDACLTAIPGVASSIPAWSHTFVEIDHEIFRGDFYGHSSLFR